MNAQAWKNQLYETDQAGNVTGLGDPEGRSHAWPVDENNRPTEKKYEGLAVSTLAYTVGGLLDAETLRNRDGDAIAVTTYEYDAVGRVAKKTTVDSKGNLKAEYVWEYWPTSEVKSISLRPLGVEISFVYNTRGELVRETIQGNNGGQTVPEFETELGGTPEGNASPESASAETEAASQLPVEDRTTLYEIDPAGNRTKMTVNGAVTTFEYNALSQLTRETSPVPGQRAASSWASSTRLIRVRRPER